MTARTALIQSVEILRGDDDFFSTASRCRRVVVGFTNGNVGTVIGGTDLLTIADVGASIADFTSDGLTYTLRDACIYQNAVAGGEAFFGTLTLTANKIELNPVDVSDYTTDDTMPVGPGTVPFQVLCFCTVA
jgi:hypothetical protein